MRTQNRPRLRVAALAAVGACAARSARCRACRMIGAFDALLLDCDALDDGAPNGSCPASE